MTNAQYRKWLRAEMNKVIDHYLEAVDNTASEWRDSLREDNEELMTEAWVDFGMIVTDGHKIMEDPHEPILRTELW